MLTILQIVLLSDIVWYMDKKQNEMNEKQKIEYEKRGYLNEDFKIFYLEDIAPAEIEYHYHDFDKILVFFKGNITYTIEGKSYTLIPGDIILVPQGDTHKVESEENSIYARLVIYLSPQYLSSIVENEKSLRDCFLHAKERYSNVVRLNEKGKEQLSVLAAGMRDDIRKKEKIGFDLLFQRTCLLQFLISLNRKMKDESLHFVNTNQCDKKIVEIIQYLNYHLTEEISIDGLADRFFVSKYHMMRRFKAETGYTIGNYINQKRLLYARELLKQGESVTKVYLDSGFKDHSTFVRAYKQMFHEVPSKRGLL